MLRYLLTSLLVVTVSWYGNAQTSGNIVGEHHLPNALDVAIYEQNGRYFGKIVRLNSFDNGQKYDIHNPDKSKRADLILGKVIIKDLKFDSHQKQWIDGTIYGLEKGCILDFKITTYRSNRIEVVASKFLFGKTLIWKRM